MTKEIFKFICHQLLGALVVPLICAVSAHSVIETLHHLGVPVSINQASRLLTKIPFFPIQALQGLLTGYFLAARCGPSSMLWIWIIPLICLLVGYASVPDAVFAYFFAIGCPEGDPCSIQVGGGVPLIASLAYSLGAFITTLERKHPSGVRGITQFLPQPSTRPSTDVSNGLPSSADTDKNTPECRGGALE